MKICPCCNQVVKPLALTTRILNIMLNEQSLTMAALHQLLSDEDYKHLHNALSALVRDKKVERIGYAKYRILP